MIKNFSEDNSIISEWIMELRDYSIQTDRMRFRKNIERVGQIIGYEISKHLNYTQKCVFTPIAIADCAVLEKQPVIATILRAGMPLFDGLLNIFDKADCAFIASYRQHTGEGLLTINQQYVTQPSIEGRPLIIADTMLATGASLLKAIQELIEKETPSQIHIVSAIASPQGVEFLSDNLSNAKIWVGCIDNGLNDNGYITPGLGDAGDLCYGKKL